MPIPQFFSQSTVIRHFDLFFFFAIISNAGKNTPKPTDHKYFGWKITLVKHCKRILFETFWGDKNNFIPQIIFLMKHKISSN